MDSAVRILHVVVNMNRGGAETLLMNLYRNIDRTKMQFDFLTCKQGVFDEEIKHLGGRIYRVPYVTDGGHTAYIQSLNKFFRTHREYMIVHSHMDKMSGFVLRAAANAGVPFRIAHSHNTNSEGGLLAKLYKSYAGYHLLKQATHFVACSENAANWLFKEKASKSIILKNGIDCSKFEFSNEQRKQIRDELNLSDDCFVMGHIGRFNHQKNHDFLIDILAETVKNNPNCMLLLVGEGDLLPAIKRKVQHLKLGNHVKFLGVRSDVHHILQAFDVFVFPSHHEGLPVTLVEAQAVGLPCIISENITREVDMGLQAVRYLPINATEPWKASIEEVRGKQTRSNEATRALTKKGYDIRSSVKLTQALYGSMVSV